MKLTVFVFALLYLVRGVLSGQAPVFTHDMNNFRITEGTPINTLVYVLQGYDPDGDPVTFGIMSDDFVVTDPSAGDVTLVREINYEERTEIVVVVSISDGEVVVQHTAYVWIDDVNDNPPIFTQTTYSITISESWTLGSVVISDIMVTDMDSMGMELTVTCQENQVSGSDTCAVFGVETTSATSQSWRGNLILRQVLNYEQRDVYQVLLRANDGVNTAVQSVVVFVTDAQDSPPVFVGDLSATLAEFTASGTTVLTVTAHDGDATQERAISYTLTYNPGNLFEIDSETGAIYTLVDVTPDNPYMASGYINLEVTVREFVDGEFSTDPSGMSTAQVTLSFVDTNSNPPTIYPSSVEVGVSEAAQNGDVIGILTATDTDQGFNGMYEVFLDNDQNTQFTFEVVPNSGQGVQSLDIRVRDARLIDYETIQSYVLTVVARETQTIERGSGVAMVTVRVNDVNDNYPVFEHDFYTASVIETAYPGTFVISIFATDLDAGINGTESVRYRVIGEGSHLFRTRDGTVTVAACDTPGSGDCLDYEQQRVYNLTYQGTDRYGEGLMTSVPLIIYILDDNDHTPTLTVRDEVSYIEEGQTLPQPPVFVQAQDTDASSVITYTIIGGNNQGIWQIDRTSGFVSATQGVRYNQTPSGQGYFVLNVRASDGANTDTGTVTIYVQDTNDNPPYFIPSGLFEEWIAEDTPSGTVIITVTALDADPPTSDNGRIQYRITSGSAGKFVINSDSGMISVAQYALFNYDIQNRYDMTVIAYDLGSPSLTATGSVIIHIRDVNDKDPYFEPSIIEIDVHDNTPINERVVTMIAIDPDASAVLNYFIIDPRLAWDLGNNPVQPGIVNFYDWFRIGLNSGDVFVNSQLDQQRAARLSLTIQARDVYGGLDQVATATLIINIIHYNDRPPIFQDPWTFGNRYLDISVPEEQPPSTYVMTLIATDPDDAGIGQYVITSNPGNHFDINGGTGIVVIREPLDYEVTQYTEFVVIVPDLGEPQLTSTCTVRVTVLNINNNPPLFDPGYYNVSIPENSPVGTSVVQVIAFDNDHGDFGTLTYVLLNDQLNSFVINSETGLITVRDPTHLDREIRPLIQMTVQAYDSPSDAEVRRYAWAQVDVHLTDMNDNPPIFIHRIFRGRIHENDPPTTFIVKVTAQDPDLGNNGRITYYIIGGNGYGLFVIDINTGDITSGITLHGYDGTYNLTVDARDSGYPQLNTTAIVIITVEPANDNPPYWITPNPNTTNNAVTHVLENQPPGTFVIKVVARDIDSGINGQVYYGFLVGGTSVDFTEEFFINRVTGDITTRIILDREMRDRYYVSLVARDQGVPTLSSTVGLTIIVDDVEDNNPEFPKFQNCCTIPYRFSVAENMPIGQILGQVSATDRDIGSNGNIIYYITDGNTGQSFSIDHNTGVISTQQMLDHEQRASYVLTVVAYNRPDQNPHAQNYPLCDPLCQQPWQVLVYITVTDENDSPPTFEYGVYNVCVSFDAPMGKSVTTIRATDYDTNTGTILYTMTSLTSNPVPLGVVTDQHVAADDNFYVVANNGTIFTRTLMTRYQNHYFTMGIQADDTGPVTGNTQARIFVTEPSYEVTITFQQPPTEIVGHEMEIIEWIRSEMGEDTIVCINDIRYYINTDYTVVPDWTDVIVVIVDGDDYTMVPPQIVVNTLPSPPDDVIFIFDGPNAGPVCGGDGCEKDMVITAVRPTYADWDGFNIHPILIVVIIIFLLLLLALLLLCCLAWCFGGWFAGDEQVTRKYIQPFALPLQTMYEDQELKMQLGQTDEIRFTGTVNDGFVADDMMANGYTTQTTTQSDWAMNYEHQSQQQTVLGADGVDAVTGVTPMIVAELEPRDSDSGIRSTSGLYFNGAEQTSNMDMMQFRSLPRNLNATGLSVHRSQTLHSGHSGIGAVLLGSQPDLSRANYSQSMQSMRSEMYSASPSADRYATSWPNSGGAYVSELQITNDDLPATIRAEPVLVTNDNPVLVTDSLDFPQEDGYQGEILLGTYHPPQYEVRQEQVQIRQYYD